ncbi:hypothetical protein BC628DRAFT_1375385 [Trametes gibbosa]|nr:hypothetical protein BC628DRAFT_1375385 [Trametes gibbosa]
MPTSVARQWASLRGPRSPMLDALCPTPFIPLRRARHVCRPAKRPAPASQTSSPSDSTWSCPSRGQRHTKRTSKRSPRDEARGRGEERRNDDSAVCWALDRGLVLTMALMPCPLPILCHTPAAMSATLNISLSFLARAPSTLPPASPPSPQPPCPPPRHPDNAHR